MNKNKFFLIVLSIVLLVYNSSCAGVQYIIYNTIIDKNDGNYFLQNEPNVKAFLEEIKNNPSRYTITAYERTLIDSQNKRTRIMTHSYYVVSDTENYTYRTLSFYGTNFSFHSVGAWVINSASDSNSFLSFYSGKNDWDVRRMDISIDTSKTAGRIIEFIDSHLSYYFWSHVKPKQDFINCNTALWMTLVEK